MPTSLAATLLAMAGGIVVALFGLLSCFPKGLEVTPFSLLCVMGGMAVVWLRHSRTLLALGLSLAALLWPLQNAFDGLKVASAWTHSAEHWTVVLAGGSVLFSLILRLPRKG
ncbi:hypothetical protein IV102_13850 [bacterium]|nr:hypothetical protein [bacterium]